MKKTTFLFIALTFIFSSCEKEIVEDQNANLTLEIHTENPNVGPGGLDCCHSENQFERQLQWFSFMAGKTLRNSTSAQLEVISALSPLSIKSISAEALIGPNSQKTNFKTEFLHNLEYYAHGNVPDPDAEGGKPPHPIVPEGLTLLTPQEIIDGFINVILNENCVELYFPNMLTFSGSYKITSSSHPLTLATSNEGIVRYYNALLPGAYEPSGDNNNSSNPIVTKEIVLTSSYVASNTNIIIARPLRSILTTTSGVDCEYLEYASIDFEEFMD